MTWSEELAAMQERQAARQAESCPAEHVDAEFAETPAPLAVIEPHQTGCLPAVSPDEARDAMRKYQEVCEAVLTAEDYQEFSQWDPKTRTKTLKKFKKKSAVKKLQTFWGVSVEIKEQHRDDLGDGHFGFRVTARATNNQGRPIEATGGCSTFEERFDLVAYGNESPSEFEARAKKARARSYHDVLSTAETRATNRAVMNCIGVGGGEVTADEVQRPSGRDQRGNGAEHRPPAQNAPREPAKGKEPQVAEVARRAFAIAVKLKLVPDDTVIFRDYVSAKYPTLGWRGVLAALENLETLAEEGEVDELSDAFASVEVEHVESTHRKLEKRVLAICSAQRIDTQRRHEMTKRMYAHESLHDLTEAQLAEFGDLLERGEAA
jgi:hypothetical protein